MPGKVLRTHERLDHRTTPGRPEWFFKHPVYQMRLGACNRTLPNCQRTTLTTFRHRISGRNSYYSTRFHAVNRGVFSLLPTLFSTPSYGSSYRLKVGFTRRGSLFRHPSAIIASDTFYVIVRFLPRLEVLSQNLLTARQGSDNSLSHA